MPRIDPRLARLVERHDSVLAKLLPVCRSVESARNELRWLKESIKQPSARQQHDDSPRRLSELVHRRARGEPLQYILGSEYFGDLEIRCRPGVLIPRQETAASVTHLVRRLLRSSHRLPQRLRVLDLCTGTGCIPLLFNHEFYSSRAGHNCRLDLTGVDISPVALALAKENHEAYLEERLPQSDHSSHCLPSMKTIRYVQADVLARDSPRVPSIDDMLRQLPEPDRTFDVLISNPPYISAKQYKTVTAQSVRDYEPRLALVPEASALSDIADGDQFYPRLWALADSVRAKVVLFEVGDHRQAVRVASMGSSRRAWQHIEIWRDEPGIASLEPSANGYDIVGTGHSRSVFAARDTGMEWTLESDRRHS